MTLVATTPLFAHGQTLFLSIYGKFYLWYFLIFRLLATALNFKRTERKLISIYLPNVLESLKWEIEKEREENIVTLR